MARYKILDQHGLNFVTLTVVDWVDVFIRKQYTAKRITQNLEKRGPLEVDILDLGVTEGFFMPKFK